MRRFPRRPGHPCHHFPGFLASLRQVCRRLFDARARRIDIEQSVKFAPQMAGRDVFRAKLTGASWPRDRSEVGIGLHQIDLPAEQSIELMFTPVDRGQDGRHVDPIWPLWNLLDLTPDGRGTTWCPKMQYD